MDENVLQRIRQADWRRIALELTRYAAWRVQKWPRRTRVTVERRLSPEDLAYNAIAAVVGGPGRDGRAAKGQRAWDPDRHPDLLDHLKNIVDSLASAAGTSEETNRVQQYHLTEDGEETEKPPPRLGRSFDPPKSEWSSGPPRNPEELLLAKEADEAAFELVMSAAEGDDELEKILEAMMEGNEKPAEIAEATGIDVKRIYQLRRKLNNRIEARQGAHHG